MSINIRYDDFDVNLFESYDESKTAFYDDASIATVECVAALMQRVRADKSYSKEFKEIIYILYLQYFKQLAVLNSDDTMCFPEFLFSENCFLDTARFWLRCLNDLSIKIPVTTEFLYQFIYIDNGFNKNIKDIIKAIFAKEITPSSLKWHLKTSTVFRSFEVNKDVSRN